MMNVSGNALTSSRRAIGNPTRERGTAFPFANVPRSRALMLRFFSPEGGITSAVAVRPRFLGDFTTEPGGRHNSAVAVATVSPSGLGAELPICPVPYGTGRGFDALRAIRKKSQ